MQQIFCFSWAPKAKRFSASGGFATYSPDQGLCPVTPLGLHPRPHYRLALRALAMRVHPTFFGLATPLLTLASLVWDSDPQETLTSPQSNLRRAASQRPHCLQWDAPSSPPKLPLPLR